jgi:hypothetical protein
VNLAKVTFVKSSGKISHCELWTGVAAYCVVINYAVVWQHTMSRFRISDDSECACRKGDQTIDHIIYDCAIVKEERERLKAVVTKTSVWPTSKRTLIKRHYKDFSKFINSISLEELNAE